MQYNLTNLLCSTVCSLLLTPLRYLMDLPTSPEKKEVKGAYVAGFTIAILHVGKLKP